jgi:hypothetical protein
MKTIDDTAVQRLRVAHQLLLEVSNDPSLWNDQCDRANQNANNALAHIVSVLRSLGVDTDSPLEDATRAAIAKAAEGRPL